MHWLVMERLRITLNMPCQPSSYLRYNRNHQYEFSQYKAFEASPFNWTSRDTKQDEEDVKVSFLNIEP